jgi:molybdenum cofactor cytidylyltransferase
MNEDVPPSSAPAILLAAGASRRMGTPKPLLPWQGKPLVRHLVHVLRDGGVSEIVVVVPPDAVGEAVAAVLTGDLDCRVVRNPDPSRGMLSSVQTGLAALRHGMPFLVCPCDLPGLLPESVAAVLAEANTPESRHAIIAPIWEGKRGHPTWFGPEYAAEALSLDPTAFGLNEILKRYAARVREIPVTSSGILHDADTPEEWQALTRNTPH